MKAIFPVLVLALCGCQAPLRLQVESFQWTERFLVRNETGLPLHDLKLNVAVETLNLVHHSPWEIPVLEPQSSMNFPADYPPCFYEVQITGRCKEGRIKGSWYASDYKQYFYLTAPGHR